MNDILRKSYEKVLHDSKFVKLTTITFLPYSLIFVWYIFYQAYFFVSSFSKNWINFEDLKDYIDQIFHFSWNFRLVIVIAIWIVIIMYFVLPPIWEWALIHYLDKKSQGSSLGKGFVNFFKMFELHSFMSFFSFLFFFIIISRIYVFGILDSVFILPLFIVWFVFVIFFNLSFFYAKYLIVLEWKTAFEASLASIKLTFLNLRKTSKYFLIYILLYLRYIINILIVVWIPFLVLWIFLETDISNIEFVKYTIFTIMFLLFVLVSYVNWIVEAFFISVWYEVFKIIDKE